MGNASPKQDLESIGFKDVEFVEDGSAIPKFTTSSLVQLAKVSGKNRVLIDDEILPYASDLLSLARVYILGEYLFADEHRSEVKTVILELDEIDETIYDDDMNKHVIELPKIDGDVYDYNANKHVATLTMGLVFVMLSGSEYMLSTPFRHNVNVAPSIEIIANTVG